MLFDGANRSAGGRTHDAQYAFASVVSWTTDRSIKEVEESWPFLNEMRRRLRALATAIEASCGDVARCMIDAAEMDDLVVYGDGRTCCVEPDDEGDACSFILGGVPVAFGDITRDPSTAVTRWMRGCTLRELASLGITVQPHAELLESGEHVRWHWTHVRERIQDPGYVAAASRPLLERLAQSDIATKFFTFTSLRSFCFSANSQHPWANDGLPVILPPDDEGNYHIDIDGQRTVCTLDAAVEFIERVLAAYSIQPFWGGLERCLISSRLQIGSMRFPDDEAP
jgi:hypothetical protein